MSHPTSGAYVSRGGDKLAAALDHFQLVVTGRICADLGSQVGGFVDCLLRRRAARVYAVDTCYGTLAWKLRRDPKVVVRERTNAMHVSLPEPVDIVTIDVGWTRQSKILPNVVKLIAGSRGLTPAARGDDDAESTKRDTTREARVVTLIKPHYEAQRVVGSAVRTDRDERGVGSAMRADGGGAAGASAEPIPCPADETLRDGVLPDEAVVKVVERVVQEMREMGWRVVGTFPSPIRGHAGNREIFALLSRA